MKVESVIGSETLFDVESRSVQCSKCHRIFAGTRKVPLNPGDECPKCGKELKRMLPHRVDVAMIFPIGECACGGFQSKHGDRPSKKSTAEKIALRVRCRMGAEEQDKLRCAHIIEARAFCLNRELAHFEKERLRHGGGRLEESAP